MRSLTGARTASADSADEKKHSKGGVGGAKCGLNTHNSANVTE